MKADHVQEKQVETPALQSSSLKPDEASAHSPSCCVNPCRNLQQDYWSRLLAGSACSRLCQLFKAAAPAVMSPCSLRMHLLWISPCAPDHLDVCQRVVSWIIKTMFSLRVIDTWLHGVAWLAMRRTIEIRLGSWSMIHPHAVDFGRKEWQMIPFDFVSRSDCLRSPPLESNKVLTSEEWRTRVIQHH